MFMAFGGFFCFYSVYNYNIGTAFRMGPGYFPKCLLGGFLFFLGFLITAKSVLFKSSEEDGGKFGKFGLVQTFL